MLNDIGYVSPTWWQHNIRWMVASFSQLELTVYIRTQCCHLQTERPPLLGSTIFFLKYAIGNYISKKLSFSSSIFTLKPEASMKGFSKRARKLFWSFCIFKHQVKFLLTSMHFVQNKKGIRNKMGLSDPERPPTKWWSCVQWIMLGAKSWATGLKGLRQEVVHCWVQGQLNWCRWQIGGWNLAGWVLADAA